MHRHLRILLAFALIVIGCQTSENMISTEYVLYGGMERDDVWIIDGGSIEGGVLYLQASELIPIAMVSQLLPPLSTGELLLLSVVARSSNATASLEVDLYGFGFDDPAQQLSVAPESLNGTFRPYSTILPSRSSDRGILLRLFTESRTSIEVDAISLTAIHPVENSYMR